MKRMVNIGVCGMGYVGKSVYAYYLAFGDNVAKLVGYDINADLINKLNKDGLDNPFDTVNRAADHIFTSDIKDLSNLDYLFICLPTPSMTDGSSNLLFIHGFIKKYLKNISHSDEALPTFVIKSTVPIGTCRKLANTYKINVIHYPEFLREGFEKEDSIKPDRTIIGVTNTSIETHAKIASDLFAKGESYVWHLVLCEESEAIKYFSNSFLATKITFANLISDFCQDFYENNGVKLDSNNILQLVGMDKRIGHGAFKSGIGFGGPCLPKDISSLISQSKHRVAEFLYNVVEYNADIYYSIICDIEKYIIKQKNNGNDFKIYFIGKYFKTGVKDIRGSIANSIYNDFKPTLGDKCYQISLEDGDAFPEKLNKYDLVVNFTDFDFFIYLRDPLMSLAPFHLADYANFTKNHVSFY